MKIVEQSVELIQITPDAAKLIENAGRTCYKSEDMAKGDVMSAEKFCKMLVDRGHESVLEHAVASIRAITNRAIANEIERHRIASYSQECLSGDTIIAKNLTIKELYESKRDSRTLKSAAFGRVIPNWTTNVFYKGKATTYNVKTKLGYSIRTTMTHEFQLEDDTFSRLENLKVGDKVMVNGRPSLLKIDDEILKEEYLISCLAPSEIATKYDAPYRSVIERLKRLGIFEKHRNDKDKSKYQKNHDENVIEKMRISVVRCYENGRRPWNFGISEFDDERVHRQANALREYHFDNSFEENNSAWNGGPKGHALARIKKNDVRVCELCGHDKDLEVHHIDRNPQNNEDENLLKTCENCHGKLHDGWYFGVRTHTDTITSIEKHGEEDVYDIEMAAPFHNYIANGFVVHNSTRYCNYNKGKFGSEISVILPTGIERCAESAFTRSDCHCSKCDTYFWWEHSVISSQDAYNSMISRGCAPEVARDVLPLCLKTELVMTANFREWRHFIKIRSSSAAHPQVRWLAEEIRKMLYFYSPSLFGPIDHSELVLMGPEVEAIRNFILANGDGTEVNPTLLTAFNSLKKKVGLK